jgi:hypothetical protein
MGAEGSTLAGAEAALVDGEHNRSRQLARRCRLLASAWATRPSALLACLLLASEVFRRSDERMVEFSIAFPVVSGAAIACSATVATVPGHLSKPRELFGESNPRRCQKMPKCYGLQAEARYHIAVSHQLHRPARARVGLGFSLSQGLMPCVTLGYPQV